MEANKISVIVPVYNAEKYLEKCVESILNQTYSNFELLLINDGSVDNSSKVCHSFETDCRVKVYDKENEGVSKTRNFGISKAEGEYLLFIDSDDYIEPDMFEGLIQAVEENRADCAVCGLIHDTMKGSRRFPEQRVVKITDGVDGVKEVLINQIVTAGPVCKLFSKDIVPEKMFPEDLSIGEDAVGVVTAFMQAERIVFDTKHGYHYNHRDESLMSSGISARDYDLITAYDRIQMQLSRYDLDRESRFRRIWARFHVLDKALLTEKTIQENESEYRKEYKDVLLWLKRHMVEILRNPYVGKKRKLAMCLLFFSTKIYRKIIAKK